MNSPEDYIEAAEAIHRFLNIEEEDVPEENRALFKILREPFESFIMEALNEKTKISTEL